MTTIDQDKATTASCSKGTPNASDEQTIPLDDMVQQLAALSDLKYEQVRRARADQYDIRVGRLDAVVRTAKIDRGVDDANSHDDHCNALALVPADTAPPGIEIHSRMVERIRRYIYLSDSRMADIIALWCMYTHAIESFRIAPKMLITAPDKACGKSTLLEVVVALACRCESLVGVSPALIYRIVDAHRPTLAFDEVDNMRNSPGYDEITAIMNAGHKRGSYVWRCDGDDHKPRKFYIFGAQIIAMIGKPKDTTASRSILVELARATAAESRCLSDISDIDPLVEWESLRAEALRWGTDHTDVLRESAQIPDGIHSRHRDNWRPLLRVAEVIGDARLIKLAQTMCIESAGGEAAAHGFTDRIMRAIASELDTYSRHHPREENIHSQHLYERLVENHDDLIPDNWTIKRLALFLGKYHCSTSQCRALGENRKGYAVHRLHSVVSRYTGDKTETSIRASADTGYSVSGIETGRVL